MDNYNTYYDKNLLQNEAKQAPVYITIDQISRFQSKKKLKSRANSTIRLAKSIQKYGILTPIEVKPTTDHNGYLLYEIIDGNQRVEAAESIGVQRIPCRILSPNDPKYAQSTAISHLKQDKLHFFDQAKAYLELINRYHMTQEEIATRLGFSQSAVANKLRLLQYTEEEQLKIRRLMLSERHVRALLQVKNTDERNVLAERIAKESLTVSETEKIIKETIAKSAIISSPSLPANGSSTTIYKTIPTQEGFLPKKFALRDLSPLYNSIERVLGIFQKTGVQVGYSKEEQENFVNISIYIPKSSNN